MTVKEVTQLLEDLSPTHYAEDFDNVGLLVGDKNTEVTGVLVTLDTLPKVVDEALEKNCNLIVSFHPIIFKGLKKLNGSDYVEKTVIKAIKHDIAIYAIHTALDNAKNGVNDIICEQLGLTKRKILIPQANTIKKLLTYVPLEHTEKVKEALFKAGAGSLGNYDECSFTSEGIGTFKGNEKSDPTIGKKHQRHHETEHLLSVTYLSHLERDVLAALNNSHPYEEVAYEVYSINNTNQNIGMGMLGELKDAMPTAEFLEFVKDRMKASCIRHSNLCKDSIKTVAVLGGSGSFAINNAIGAKADIFITADLKYHDFFMAENQIILADIGHYESEQFTKSFLYDYLSKKITNFAPALPKGGVVLSTTNTNPVKYL